MKIEHPVRQTPLAMLLSRLSLPAILGIYGFLTAVWILISSAALYFIDPGTRSFGDAMRRSTWAMWGADNLLGQDGKPLLYYALGVLNGCVSIVLPVFLLGAFVFKLFRHDPLQWRSTLTIEAHPSGVFVLAARFYNKFTVDVADLRVRAWIRWIPDESETVRRNRRLELLGTLPKDIEDALPLAATGEPTTTRIRLASTSDTRDPLGSDGRITIQGESVPRRDAHLVIVIDGLTGTTNEAFHSTKTYSLASDIVTEYYQNIPLDVAGGAEWKNFDGTQLAYLFLYGSLMRAGELRALGVSAVGAPQVEISGWRRSWSVIGDAASEVRSGAVDGGGARRDEQRAHHFVELGLVRAETRVTRGVLIEADYRLLAQLDSRRNGFCRMDVTSDVEWESRSQALDGRARVYTYVPQQQADWRFEKLKQNGLLAIDRSYWSSIEHAAQTLDERILHNLHDAEHRDELPVLDRPGADDVAQLDDVGRGN